MAEIDIAAIEAGNDAEFAAYDIENDANLEFCFEKPAGWHRDSLPWGSSPTLRELLERRHDLRPLKLSFVWAGTNLVWGFTDDEAPWRDPE